MVNPFNLTGIVYYLSKSELDKWDAEHQIEMNEFQRKTSISQRKQSHEHQHSNTQQSTYQKSESRNPETEI